MEQVDIDIAESDSKQCFLNHTVSFGNQRYKNDTILWIFLWDLKKSTKEIPKLTWSVLKVVSGCLNIFVFKWEVIDHYLP